MTFRRLAMYGFVGIVAALLMSVASGAVTSATDPKAYWNGPTEIIIQHPFFSYSQEEDEDIKERDNSAIFTLDRSTRYPFRFVSENISVEVKHEGNICNYTSLFLDLHPDSDGTYTTRTPYSYVVGASSGTSGLAVRSSSITSDAIIPASVAGLDDPCEVMFVDNIPFFNSLPSGFPDVVKSATEGLREPIKIRGEMGDIAELTIFREQLGISKSNETTRYTHRMCGTDKSVIPNSYLNPPPAASLPPLPSLSYTTCVDNAKKSYDVIWQYCERYALGLWNQYERVDSFKSCIESRSGLDVHASSLDSTLLNTIDYTGGESCSIRYIGWIICPLSRFMASVTDAAFDGLSQFFVISPLGREEQAGAALYRAWSLINNFANVLFIIAFMVVIFSQLTGRGMSNLGIKRLLPKIILTAILVNASYYICIVAVDLSNILGVGLKDVIKAIEPESFRAPSTWTQEVENLLVFGAAAAGGAFIILTASLVAMLPLLVGALLSLVIAVIMLVARYALILILIILAPVAIACTLLPNTQKWYNQWFKLFTSMLMLFPLVSIVFGGSQVAGILVLNSSLSRSTGDITLQLFGLAIMALPLAITPILVRLGGGILNRFGGVVSNRGFFKNTKERTQGFVDRRKNARDVKALTLTGDKKRRGLAGMRDGLRRREYLRKAQHSLNEGELSSSQSSYATGYRGGEYGGDKASNPIDRAKQIYGKYNPMVDEKDYQPDPSDTRGAKFAKNQAKGGLSDASAQAIALSEQIKINTENVNAAKAGPTIQRALASDYGQDNMQNMVRIATDANAGPAIRQAAIELVMESGQGGDIDAVVKSVGSMKDKNQRRAVAIGTTSSNAISHSAYYSHPDTQRTIMGGDVNDGNFHEKIVAPWLNARDYSEKSIGSMHQNSIQEVNETLASGSVSSSTASDIAQVAGRASADQSIQTASDARGNKDQRKAQLDNIFNTHG